MLSSVFKKNSLSNKVVGTIVRYEVSYAIIVLPCFQLANKEQSFGIVSQRFFSTLFLYQKTFLGHKLFESDFFAQFSHADLFYVIVPAFFRENLFLEINYLSTICGPF